MASPATCAVSGAASSCSGLGRSVSCVVDSATGTPAAGSGAACAVPRSVTSCNRSTPVATIELHS